MVSALVVTQYTHVEDTSRQYSQNIPQTEKSARPEQSHRRSTFQWSHSIKIFAVGLFTVLKVCFSQNVTGNYLDSERSENEYKNEISTKFNPEKSGETVIANIPKNEFSKNDSVLFHAVL